MPPLITLATYSLRIRPRRKKDYELLDALDGGRVNFLGLCRAFFESVQKKTLLLEKTKFLHRIEHLEESDNGRRLFGTLRSGDYGYEAELWDTGSLKHAFQRTPDHAELLPFYFQVYSPPHMRVAFLTLQRFSSFGVYSSIGPAMAEYVGNAMPGYLLESARLVPKAVLDALLHSELTSIRVKTFSPPRDLCDLFKLGGNFKQDGSLTLTFKAEYGNVIPEPKWVQRLRLGKVKLAELPDGFDPSTTEVRFGYTYNGKTRQVDLSDLQKAAPYYDVTPDVALMTSGHPTFESIHQAACSLVDELVDQTGSQ